MTTQPLLGRRPGESGTSDQILEAARQQFSLLGYDRASIRSIAREARVDPSLVLHYFHSKQSLFVAAAELPFNPGVALPVLLSGDRALAGERLANFMLGVLESPSARARIQGLIRAAASEEEAARMVRDLVEEQFFAPLTVALGVEQAELRASLIGSQVVGLVMARYIVAVEPLATAPPEVVAAAIAPVFQYLIEGSLESSIL